MTARIDVHVLAYSAPAASLVRCLASLDRANATGLLNIVVQHGGYDGHIGEARYHAFQHGDADYVSFVDDDDWLLGGAAVMQQCVNILDARPQLVGVYTDVAHVDVNGGGVREERKAAWQPIRQLCHGTEVLHLHVFRRAPLAAVADHIRAFRTFEEYVLLGLLTAYGDWHHIPSLAYAKTHQPAARSSMRLAVPGLWQRAVRTVLPSLCNAAARCRLVERETDV